MINPNLSKRQPESYRCLTQLDASVAVAAKRAGLDPLLIELVKIRVSQLNGCAYCLRMHTRDAIRLGRQPSGWRCSRPGGSRSTSPSRNARRSHSRRN